MQEIIIKKTMGKNLINVALFGLGRIGLMHANNLINNKNLDIENNSLVVKNKIYDGEGKEFANFSRNYVSIGNTENSKNITGQILRVDAGMSTLKI